MVGYLNGENIKNPPSLGKEHPFDVVLKCVMLFTR